MRLFKSAGILTALTLVAAICATELVRAGADQVAFPEDFAKGVEYLSMDRAGGKLISVFYTSREAIEAAKKGQSLPSGTLSRRSTTPRSWIPKGIP